MEGRERRDGRGRGSIQCLISDHNRIKLRETEFKNHIVLR